MNDKLFLLSVEEYEAMKENISKLQDWWWLRSPGDFQLSAADVGPDGSVHYSGDYVYDAGVYVRPAFKLEVKCDKDKDIHIFQNVYDYIGEYDGYHYYLAKYPYCKMPFGKTNDYTDSDVRKYLLDIVEKGN